MPRPSTAAVADAIRQCQQLGLRTEQSSALEAVLAAYRMRRRALPVKIANADDVVREMFGLRPDHPDDGRVYLFKSRGSWGSLVQPGRSTVWNVTTRSDTTLAATLFQEHERGGERGVHRDIRGGPRSDASAVLGGYLTTGGEDQRPSWRALAAVLLRDDDLADEQAARAGLLDYLGHLDAEGAVRPLDDAELDAFTTDDALRAPLLAGSPDEEFDSAALPDDVLPTVQATPTLGTEAVTPVAYDIVGDVVVDPRVERMLETAVRAYRAVLLVGPPGSGKNTLLKRLVARAQQDPQLLGLSRPPELPLTRTPDESWTSFELVGGQAPAEGGLRYSSGAVLDAIRADRWLLLDETNRADMDKIFGALLTWLSMDAVELGTLTPGAVARVSLGWNTTSPRSTVTPDDGLSANADATDEVAFRAGTDWRLLGTYNPQDAQRVFRFGVALSRRFAIVPVPPLTPTQFETLLDQLDEARPQALPADLNNRISTLYQAHFASATTQLGPAVFLRMVEYVLSARGHTGTDVGSGDPIEAGDDSEQSPGGGQNLEQAGEQSETSTESAAHPMSAALLDELVAEAYLVRVGKYLSTYDSETVEELGQRITGGNAPALSVTQWAWAVEHRVYLG